MFSKGNTERTSFSYTLAERKSKTPIIAIFMLMSALSIFSTGSKDPKSNKKLFVPGLSACETKDSFDQAPLAFVLYSKNESEQQLFKWKAVLKSFERRGVFVLILAEDVVSKTIEAKSIDKSDDGKCVLSDGEDFFAINNLPRKDQYAILLDSTKRIIEIEHTNMMDNREKFLETVVSLTTTGDLRTFRFEDSFPPGCPGVYSGPE